MKINDGLVDRRSIMSNLAHQLEKVQQQQSPVQKKAKMHVKKRRFTAGEKLLIFLFCAIFLATTIKIVTYQAAIYEVNKDIQHLELSIEEITKENVDLANQVSELSTYERIWEKALELGLLLNENNVKVVQE